MFSLSLFLACQSFRGPAFSGFYYPCISTQSNLWIFLQPCLLNNGLVIIISLSFLRSHSRNAFSRPLSRALLLCFGKILWMSFLVIILPFATAFHAIRTSSHSWLNTTFGANIVWHNTMLCLAVNHSTQKGHCHQAEQIVLWKKRLTACSYYLMNYPQKQDVNESDQS